MDYEIISKKENWFYKYAIFINNKQISDWFDAIYDVRSREEGSSIEYAVFSGNIQYSKWCKDLYDEYLVGRYFFVKSHKGKEEKSAIYELKGEKLDKIEEFNDFINIGLLRGKSRFMITIKNINGKKEYGLYEYKNKQIVKVLDGYDYIYGDGLVSGESNFLLVKKDGVLCLYEYKNDNFILVHPSVRLSTSDLLNGKSHYFIAEKDNKFAIYEYKDNKVNQVTLFYDDITEDGLMKNLSNFFVMRENIIGDYKSDDYIMHKLIDIKLMNSALWRFKIYRQLLTKEKFML